MKKFLYALLVALLVSCEYKDLAPKICYLATEDSYSGFITYTYNAQNELVSYSAPDVYSSVITYEGGKVSSEIDNEVLLVTYTYDSHGRISLWSETVQGYPEYSIQKKFFYNSFNQDTLQQFFKFDTLTSQYYLFRYTRRNFASATTKNYSQIKAYDAATNALLYTENFGWDNHPNPYLTNVFFQNETPPTNNLTHYALTLPDSVPQVSDFSYTYNSNGFPVYKLVLPDQGLVAHYSYTNCQ